MLKDLRDASSAGDDGHLFTLPPHEQLQMTPQPYGGRLQTPCTLRQAATFLKSVARTSDIQNTTKAISS
jgi:hypothetical protein